MNRLVNSSYDDRKESFTYDKVGNRLTKTTNDITEKYVYNVKNQLREVYREKGNSTQVPSLSKFDLAKYKIGVSLMLNKVIPLKKRQLQELIHLNTIL